MIFTLLFLLPLLQQQVTPTYGQINYDNIINYICPKSNAVGEDLGQKSVIIFRSPTSKQDVTLQYADGSWGGEEAMKQLVENGFNPNKETLLFSHGFHQSGNITWLMNARRIYDEMQSSSFESFFNMFIFDWSSYADYSYGTSVSYVPHLGRILGQFMEQLGKSQSYDMDKLHLIAYSLSTHIAGLAGRYVASAYAPIGQLTALDPTGVCLHHPSAFSDTNALRQTDAKFVVARHYNMDGFGAKRPIGGLDIFVNGGKTQPNPPAAERRGFRFRRDVEGATGDDGDGDEEFDEDNMVVMARSDHHRATEHETQALDQECHDMAYECASYESYLKGECADCGPDGSKCYFVSNFKQLLAEQRGEQYRNKTSYKPGTKMYLKTYYQESFCLHHYQILAELSQNASTDTQKLLSSGAIEFKVDDEQPIKLSGPIDGNKFTALISSVKKIQKLEGMVLKVNANDASFKTFLNSLDHVEMNYMSHPMGEERAKASYRLCLDSARNSLIKCEE